MAQTINVQRDFLRPLLPIEAVLDRVVNPEPVLRHSNCQSTLDQHDLIELRADLQLPELCNSKDMVIAVLEGRASLALNQEVVILEPEIVVFIPSHTPHRLRTQTDLIFLLSTYESSPAVSESVLVINL